MLKLARHLLAFAFLAFSPLLLTGCLLDTGGPGTQSLVELQAEPLAAVPWQWGEIPGTAITTSHYHIYTTIKDPTYQRLLAKVLEGAHERFLALNGLPSPAMNGPFDAYVFGDRSQWELYTRLKTGPEANTYLQISAGGFCRQGIFAGYDIGRESTLSVIAHEAFHQLSWFTFKDRLPSFLDEGFATQNEAIEWQGAVPIWVPERNYRRFQALRLALHENRLWTIDELTATHAGKVIVLSQKHVDAYYAQIWSLLLFLEHSHYRANLQDLLARAREGRLTQSLAGTGVGPFDIANYTERWNQTAGPVYLRKFIASDPKKLEQEYLHFIHDLTDNWPPRLPEGG